MPKEESKILEELFPEEEKVPIVERKEGLEGIEGIKGLEAIERELHTVPTVRNGWGKILAQPPTPKKVNITLPITRQQYLAGFSQPVVNSLRWLVVWIGRLVKMVPEKVVFRTMNVKIKNQNAK